MNTIHISTGNGQSSQYDEDQVRSMLQEGFLRDDTLFWKAGMSGWQHLRVLFPPSATVQHGPPPIPQEASVSNYTFAKNPFGLTQALKVMLWVQLGVAVISMLSDFGQMSLASSGNITRKAVGANDVRQVVIGLLYLGVFISTSIVFLKWIYRANLNCRGFGVTDMKFSPAWSIGYYFIPFLNLVCPYQAMKEIWKVSSDPKDWKQHFGVVVGTLAHFRVIWPDDFPKAMPPAKLSIVLNRRAVDRNQNHENTSAHLAKLAHVLGRQRFPGALGLFLQRTWPRADPVSAPRLRGAARISAGRGAARLRGASA